MYRSIQQLIQNIKAKYYGTNMFCIGPLMMKRFFNSSDFNKLELMHEYVNYTTKFIKYKDHRILKLHPKYYKDSLSPVEYQKQNWWKQDWANRKLYK